MDTLVKLATLEERFGLESKGGSLEARIASLESFAVTKLAGRVAIEVGKKVPREVQGVLGKGLRDEFGVSSLDGLASNLEAIRIGLHDSKNREVADYVRKQSNTLRGQVELLLELKSSGRVGSFKNYFFGFSIPLVIMLLVMSLFSQMTFFQLLLSFGGHIVENFFVIVVGGICVVKVAQFLMWVSDKIEKFEKAVFGFWKPKPKKKRRRRRATKEARALETLNKVVEFLPLVSRLKGAGKELLRLVGSSFQDLVSTFELMVRKDKWKILEALKKNFDSQMSNAFQTFTSVKEPPKLKEINFEKLLDSVYEHKGEKFSLRELLEADSIVGQGAYTTYNSWVMEYGYILDHALGRPAKMTSKQERDLLKNGASALKRASNTFYRFLGLWLKATSQTALVTSLWLSVTAMSFAYGGKIILRKLVDMFNEKVTEEIKEDKGGPMSELFTPSRVASRGGHTLMLVNEYLECLNFIEGRV